MRVPHTKYLRGVALCAAVAACGAIPGMAAWTPTGADIPTRFGMGALLSSQTIATGFGDNKSELDQLFVKSDGEALNIGITGNIENNGNGVVILLDTKDGGSSSFNYTGGDGSPRINELNGDTLDSDFSPEYAVDVNNSGGTLYVDLYDLANNTKTYLGNCSDGGAAGALTGGGSAAFSNGNTAGVTDSAALDGSAYPLAAGATTGVEVSLPLEQVGATNGSARVMAVLIGSGGYVSNQVLPGLPDTTANLANGPTNYQHIPGEQSALVGLTTSANDLPSASVPWAYTPVYLSDNANVDAHPPVTSVPSVLNGVAYVSEDVVDNAGNHTGNIVAIDAHSTGTAHLVTTFGTNGRVTGLDGPVLRRIAIYYAGNTPRLYAMTAKGTLYVMDAETGGNLRSVPVFPDMASACTPAVTSSGELVNIIVSGLNEQGDAQLVRVPDEPTLAVAETLTLAPDALAATSPSVLAGGSRIQVAIASYTQAGPTGIVYTVDASNFTVFNAADADGFVAGAPTLTSDPPGLMIVSAFTPTESTIKAFNASNANLVWSQPISGPVADAAFVDYQAHPNVAYIENFQGFPVNSSTTPASLVAVNAGTGAPMAGYPANDFPGASGTPLLLRPSGDGSQGSAYVATGAGMYVTGASAPSSTAARRFPVSGVTTTPSATGSASGDVVTATIGVGAALQSVPGPTGTISGNVYGLTVQGPLPTAPRP